MFSSQSLPTRVTTRKLVQCLCLHGNVIGKLHSNFPLSHRVPLAGVVAVVLLLGENQVTLDMLKQMQKHLRNFVVLFLDVDVKLC